MFVASYVSHMVWYGLVWFGMVWYGLVWYGLVWFGMVLSDNDVNIWYSTSCPQKFFGSDLGVGRIGKITPPRIPFCPLVL